MLDSGRKLIRVVRADGALIAHTHSRARASRRVAIREQRLPAGTTLSNPLFFFFFLRGRGKWEEEIF